MTTGDANYEETSIYLAVIVIIIRRQKIIIIVYSAFWIVFFCLASVANKFLQ